VNFAEPKIFNTKGLTIIYDVRPNNIAGLTNKWDIEIWASPILAMDRRPWVDHLIRKSLKILKKADCLLLFLTPYN